MKDNLRRLLVRLAGLLECLALWTSLQGSQEALRREGLLPPRRPQLVRPRALSLSSRVASFELGASCLLRLSRCSVESSYARRRSMPSWLANLSWHAHGTALWALPRLRKLALTLLALPAWSWWTCCSSATSRAWRNVGRRLGMRSRPRIVSILGESGGGKSTIAQALVEGAPRVIVAAPYMKNPYGAIPFSDYEAALDAMLAYRPKTFRIAVATYTPKELAKVCRLAWACAPVLLVIDETATCIPNAAAAPEELRYISQIGRHAGHDEEQPVELIILGQRPANLPPYVRSESKEVYVFPLAWEEDCERVAADFSLPGDVRRQVVERIPRLAKYHRLRLTKRDDGGWDVQEGQGT